MDKILHKKRQERKDIVAKRLKKLMKQKKLSSRSLSHLSGVGLPSIKRIELGHSLGTVVNAMRISKALGLSVEEVFNCE